MHLNVGGSKELRIQYKIQRDCMLQKYKIGYNDVIICRVFANSHLKSIAI